MNLSEYQNYHETKSHTAEEFPYTTYLCSIPLDFTHVPPHWHMEIELIVIKKGRGTVTVDSISAPSPPETLYSYAPGSCIPSGRRKIVPWSTRISF